MTRLEQTVKDKEHLKVLGIFNLIFGIIGIFLSCFFLIYFFLGYAFYNGSDSSFQDTSERNMAAWIFMVIGGIPFVLGEVISLASIFSGVMLLRLKNRMFSCIVAFSQFIIIPFGTTLGAFSVAVLFRDSVQELYLQIDTQQPQPAKPKKPAHPEIDEPQIGDIEKVYENELKLKSSTKTQF